jgi:hypothetical protein
LKQCIEGNNAPPLRDFTRFLAKAILERQQTWPSQAAVKDGTAPKQLLDEWEEGKRLTNVNSPPPAWSPPTSPRPRKENKGQPKREVQEQTELEKGGSTTKRRSKRDKRASILDYICQHPDQFPPVERHQNGRPVTLDENDAYEKGLKVVLVCDPKERRAQFAYLVFVELDPVVNSELGPLPINATASGRLFMLLDFVPACGPKKGKPMEGLIIEEVQNMALARGEVREFRRQRNRAMLASWGKLKIKSEQDKLRTMSWVDLGFRYNIKPFRKESVQRYVTLSGAAEDQYLNETKLGFDMLLEHRDAPGGRPSAPGCRDASFLLLKFANLCASQSLF